MQKVFLATILLAATAASAEPVRLLVDFKDDSSIEDVRDSEEETGLNLEPVSMMFSATKLTSAMVDSSRVAEYIDELDGDMDIEAVEVSQTYSIFGGADFDTPNDKAYSKQRWHFDMIGLEKAWKHSTGKGVVVAVLDTGVSDGKDANYPRVGDLAETKFVPGYNFIDNNDRPNDGHAHGTHVASSIAESTNNSIGGVGIAFDAAIMPVKVLSDHGSGSTEGIAEGIRWATDNGANIINMSLGGGGHSNILASAVKYAADNNVLVFCAAGNSAVDQISYPAAYKGCLAISSVGPKGDLAPYSQYGKGGDGIFLASPGGDTRGFGEDGAVWQSTIVRGNPKQWAMQGFQGTSMATPIAAGSAALVVSRLMEDNDGRFDSDEVKDILTSNTTSKSDKYKFGAGIVNVGDAVEEAGNNSTAMFAGAAGILALVAGALFVRSRKR